MNARGRYRRVERRQFVSSDPIASMKAGAQVAAKAGVPFALAGRLAVWFYVPPEGQQLTKDADFAIPIGYGEAVRLEAEKAGYKVQPLGIGGYGLSALPVVVDFIDRSPLLPQLFSDAVTAAKASRVRLRVGRHSVPVVPVDFLIAMKLVPHEPKDERDVEELLYLVPASGYKALQALVTRYLGPLGMTYLDSIARRIGHRGPGMKSRYRRTRR